MFQLGKEKNKKTPISDHPYCLQTSPEISQKPSAMEMLIHTNELDTLNNMQTTVPSSKKYDFSPFRK